MMNAKWSCFNGVILTLESGELGVDLLDYEWSGAQDLTITFSYSRCQGKVINGTGV